MSGRYRTALAWVGWLAGLATSGWWLAGLGHGRLAGPPVRHPARWARWVQHVGPVDASFALLRLACLVAVGYLAVVLVVGALAQLSGARPLLAVSEAISFGLVRRLVHGTLGLSMTAGAMTAGSASLLPAASPAGAAQLVDAGAVQHADPTISTTGGTGATLTMRAAAAEAPPAPGAGPVAPLPRMRTAGPGRPLQMRTSDATAPLAVRAGGSTEGLTMRAAPLEDRPSMRSDQVGRAPTMRPGQPAQAPTMRPGPPAEAPTMRAAGSTPAMPAADIPPGTARDAGATPPPAAPEADGGTLPTAPTERVLVPGDHLWSVADEQVTARLGRPGTLEEVTSYWRRLVDLNREQLADPLNPDLVFAGQVVRLPLR